MSLLGSLFIPIRTDSLANFCKDFFFPGFLNTILKTNSFATQMISVIMLSIYNFFTLPIRCIVTLIHNHVCQIAHPKEKHPFYQYLIGNGVPAANLSADYVYVEREYMERRGQGGEFTLANREIFNFI